MKFYPLIFSFISILLFTTSVQACPQGGGGNCNQNDAGSTQTTQQPDENSGNPINVVTGNKFQQELDYQASGDLSALAFNRFYNSLNHAYDDGLGLGWSHSFELWVTLKPKEGFAQIIQSDGRRIIFKRLGTDGSLYHGLSPQDGVLNRFADGKVIWSLHDGRHITFFQQKPIEIAFPGNKILTLKYYQGHIRLVTDNQGRRLVFNYTQGNAALGNFAKEGDTDVKLAGHLASVELPDGGKIHYHYDSDHNLSKVTYPDKTSRMYHYETLEFPNHLTGITDRTGKRFATWGYDDEGRANLSTHAKGVEKVTLEYKIPTQAGKLGKTIVTNSLGQKSTHTWQFYPKVSQSLLLSSKGPGCSTCPAPNKRYSYNNQYQLETATDTKTDTITAYKYDKLGRSQKITITQKGEAERLITRYEYQGKQPRPSLIARPSVNKEGEHITAITYNDDQLPIALTEKGFSPLVEDNDNFKTIERTTKLAYTNGNLTTIDGPRDDVQDLIQLAYDQNNRLQTLTQANGQTLKVLAYDVNGHPTKIQKGTQSPLTIAYNPQGQATEIKQRNRAIQYGYDLEGRLTKITSADGEVIAMTYDDAGRLNTLNDNKGRKIQQLHDSESRPQQTQLMGASGNVLNTISYLYDAQGRLDKTQTQNLDGETETDYQYDEKGQLVKVEKNDQAVSLSYNNLGQLLGLTQPGDVVTQFNYDNKGQSNALIDARDNKTQTIKDDFGRTIQHISPDTGTNTYAYDKAGNRIKRTDPEHNVTTYQWSAANQLIKKVTISSPLSLSKGSNTTETTTFEYDPQTGKLSSTTNPNTTESFQYNNEGQLTKHTREIDGHSFSTGYEYNDQDKLHKKHLPDGQTLRYHYYANSTDTGFLSGAEGQTGKLRAITRDSLFGFKQDNIIAEIDNDKTDGKSGYLSHNGLKTEYTFREDGQLQGIQIADALKLHYSYDQNGNITGIDENGTTQAFLYDQGRLTFADTLTGTYQYDYDKVGNRTHKVHTDKMGGISADSYTYAEPSQGNKILSTSSNTLDKKSLDLKDGEAKNLAYNKKGSPLETDKFTYEYNTNQRPIKVFKPTETNKKELIAEYQYNTFGERIKKTTYANNKKTVTYYFYDGHTLTAEANEQGEIQSQYIYLNHQPVAKLEKKTVYAIHSDHLGTPRLATNDDKQTVWKANYSPFGKATLETNNIRLNLRFPGQYEDQETGTHYNYLRDYDPETGRYITSDPIGLKGGFNTYAYADNNPLSKIDTLGLKPTAQVQQDGSWWINASDYQELTRLLKTGKRTEYYFRLYELTGSQLAIEMAQISSNSGFFGGVAWRANEEIMQLQDRLYPGHGQETKQRIQEFSVMVAANDFSELTQVACTFDRHPIYRIPTDLEMLESTLALWERLGLRDYAPPLVRLEQEINGVDSAGWNMFPGLGSGEPAFDIVRNAVIAETATRPAFGVPTPDRNKGFYEQEFIRDHGGLQNITVEYSADGEYKIIKSDRSKVQDMDKREEYDTVSSSPDVDVIVIKR